MKSNTQVSNTTNQVKHEARRAATSKWMVIFARLGYAIKGVVYLIIGILAVQVAIGVGGKTTDQNGAIQTISHLPLGGFLLIVVTIGLFGFAIWSFIQAIFDTEGKGRDAKGIVSRIGYAAVGIGYAAIGYATLRIVIGSASGGTNSTTRTQDVTATLLKLPLGPVLVVIAAIVVLCIAGYLFYKAYSAKFQQRLALSGLGARMRSFAIGLGRLGYAALGLVFTVISIFLIVAAVQHNPDRAVGLDGSLHELALQPFGKLLLGVVALGLIAYGAYSFVEARYRRIG